MKKTLFILVLLAAIFTSYSQSNKIFFVKAGISSNTIKDNKGAEKNATSPYIGVGLEFGDKFSFQSELLFNIYKLNIGNSEYSKPFFESYDYNGNVIRVSLPLLIKQEVVEHFSLYAGITPSLILIDKSESETNRTISGTVQPTYPFSNSSSFNGAFTIGAEYAIKENFFIEARYNFSPSFLTVSDDANILSTSTFFLNEKSNIQFGIGYRLF